MRWDASIAAADKQYCKMMHNICWSVLRIWFVRDRQRERERERERFFMVLHCVLIRVWQQQLPSPRCRRCHTNGATNLHAAHLGRVDLQGSLRLMVANYLFLSYLFFACSCNFFLSCYGLLMILYLNFDCRGAMLSTYLPFIILAVIVFLLTRFTK